MSSRESRFEWSVGHGAIALLALVTVFFVLGLFTDLEDVLRAYPSPERHAGVTRLEAPASAPEDASRGDFDGDGVDDVLDLDDFHMEPLHARTTSGMLYVRSSTTHEVLLAHAVDTPMNRAHWCGDVDGNGTDDVYVEDDGRRFVLARTAAR